ncbi:hypothetical protein AMATHDRAFT_143841 [Amanita thiersii Skay4041]|uniref:N-acetyltransferase domain-containing protein n=1 Tax=Amanita thiersii Skay4041 TaxID=703135 RepID=A0A2A9NLE2_9AGAR|nr:hypothetical protein AMATHDRAFT_143841 [Amanita thiersii Skay4041]
MMSQGVELISPTGRIKLVPPTADDDEAVIKCRTHPISRQNLRFLPEQMSMNEVRTRRDARSNNPCVADFHIHLMSDDGSSIFCGMTGYFNLDMMHSSCEVGILIPPDAYRKKIGTEALYTVLKWIFEEKKVHRVTFETGQDNTPMRTWLEEVAGARLEAQRKECWRNVDGSYSDVAGYSILDWEWLDSVKVRLEARLKV